MHFISLLKQSKNYSKLFETFQQENEKVFIIGKTISFFSYLISVLFLEIKKTFFIVLPDEIKAEKCFLDIQNFLSSEKVQFLPSPDFFSTTNEGVSENMYERVKIFFSLLQKTSPFIIITYFPAILKKIPSPKLFLKEEITLKVGEIVKREVFLKNILRYGYEEKEIVEIPGEFARRGGIIDIFPPDMKFPLRIEFSGDKIVSLRKFDISTQVSIEKVENFYIYPLNEDFISFQTTSSIIEFLENSIIFLINPSEFNEEVFYKTIPQNIKNMVCSSYEIEYLKELSHIFEENFKEEIKTRKTFYFNVSDVSERFKIGERFIWNKYNNEKLFIFSGNLSQENRIKEILKEKKISFSDITFYIGILSSGFSFPEIGVSFLSNDEIFSRYQTRRIPLKKIENIPLSTWEELKKGDFVVHYNEGIGKFIGMEKTNIGGKEEEFIVLEYAGNDKLYVPLEQISFIHKYIGNSSPTLSKLGSKTWIKTKEKVKNSIRDLASDLYKLYKERKKEKGFSFLPDDQIQKEFEESFIYEETDDQLKAIEEVKTDMVSQKIMDRLLCGDSGYGKTEVAMRASFKAVLSGKQVAVLVPTTVLALQHLFTFRERFADFPVKIEMLSRFISDKKQKEILNELSSGKVDIIIGTHRILQEDIKFKDLGLLIIDEEQRFGVIHKEKIKTIFRGIDVLTLTATPIPRTLYLSLSGLRDISIIETPPLGRLSVITYIGKYNEEIVKEAVIREIERKGQVFYLHNFIYDIENVKEKLCKLVPYIKIETAHGKMEEKKLAKTMEDFSSGKIDVLVATTIVENGLDIPRANTLIVDNAHKFGLADLYQLRGRVGRYKWRAYAYFLIPPHVYLTEKSQKRLKALQQLNNPGSGFKIALKDMEIRGAGNILGKEQHGFIEQVGFNLYCQFWKEINEEISQKIPETPKEIKIKGEIPYQYISSPSMRFWLYKKITEINEKEKAKKLIEELKDRFGPVPAEVEKMILEKVH